MAIAKTTALTAKQEAFACAYVELQNATAAYRQVYQNNASDATARKRASELLTREDVSDRIAELQAAAAEKAVLTLEGHLDDLLKLRNMAAKKNQFAAAITAEVNRGKAAGLYVTRIAGPDGGALRTEHSTPPEGVDWLGFPLKNDDEEED